jgi:tetratricopeptide (TPR) repeat protein
MTHKPSSPDRPSPYEAARRLLHAHLACRSYAACVAAAPALVVPRGFAGDADLWAAAAAGVAQTFGLLDAGRSTAAVALMRAGLAGAADAAMDRAAPDAGLAWCTAATEWCERHGLDHEFARLRARAAVADAQAGASPFARVHWRIAAAWHHEWFGRRADVAALLGEAAAVAARAQDEGLQVVVTLRQARLALARCDPDQALALARRAAAHADEASSPLWLADAADVAARAAMVQGDMHRALQQSRRAVGLADLAQATPSFTFTYRLYEAYALLGLGAWDEAVALAQALALIDLPDGMRTRTALLPALFALVRDDRSGSWGEDSARRLAALLRRLRELEWPGVLPVLPDHLSRLWARALDAGIETDWVRASILGRELAPPAPAWPEAWPWAVRIRVLGAFRCQVGDADLGDAGARAAAKPLALLRRVAAEGGYDGVGADSVALALWPGEGRAGRDKALEVTLARLRRALGHADAVLLHERRLRLNPRRVWLDRSALERHLDALAHDTAADAALRDRHWAAVWSLWRGPLLADAAEEPVLAALRESVRARLAAALHAAAAEAGHRARCLRAIAGDPALQRWL